MLTRPASANRRRQRGLSIVELMVGVTIGLIVVAAAAVMMSSQLVENRRLMVEAQLQQDLRAAADIITRDLRRSAYLSQKNVGSSTAALDTLDSFVATSTNPAPPQVLVNDLQADFSLPSSSSIAFNYVASDDNSRRGPFGYALSGGVLKADLGPGAGPSQDLTDARTMEVTEFSFSPITVLGSQRVPCPKLCTGGGTGCWPIEQVRSITFTIKARGRGINQNITREVSSTVRLRNDFTKFGATNICP
jgi:type IV pilus assembly protein PilW